jgi:hypothetical protein
MGCFIGGTSIPTNRNSKETSSEVSYQWDSGLLFIYMNEENIL